MKSAEMTTMIEDDYNENDYDKITVTTITMMTEDYLNLPNPFACISQ